MVSTTQIEAERFLEKRKWIKTKTDDNISIYKRKDIEYKRGDFLNGKKRLVKITELSRTFKEELDKTPEITRDY